jgi:hypothetical protein
VIRLNRNICGDVLDTVSQSFNTRWIAAIRSPEEVKRKILEKSGGDGKQRLSCAPWNGLFIQVTAMTAPNLKDGCGGAGLERVGFDDWFTWLGRQR